MTDPDRGPAGEERWQAAIPAGSIDCERRRVSWAAAGLLSLAGCSTLPLPSTTSAPSPHRSSDPPGSHDAPGSSESGPATAQADVVSGCRLVDGRMGVARVAADGSVRWVRPLSMRVHEILVDAPRACLHVFARRPGRERWCLSIDSGTVLLHGDSGPGHVACGHGIVTRDGLLVTTEARLTDGTGSLAVREAGGGRLIARFDCGGFDPHMIAAMPDGNTVVVAIGGARDGEGGAARRSRATSSRSALAYFDLRDGRCLGRYEAWHPALSIRHLGVAPDGRVLFGTQWRGAETSIDPEVPLLGSHHGGERPRPVSGDAAQWTELRGYVGSVAVSEDGAQAWASSPRGGRVVRWSVRANRLSPEVWLLQDVCGLAFVPGSRVPLLSTGAGRLAVANAQPVVRQAGLPVQAWDNHMASIGGRASRSR